MTAQTCPRRSSNVFLPGPPTCPRFPGAAAPRFSADGRSRVPDASSVWLRRHSRPVTFLPEGEGCRAASEDAAELLYGLLALLSVLKEGDNLLFGECACFHRSSSLSREHKGSPCAPPGEIRMTPISFVHFQGGTSGERYPPTVRSLSKWPGSVLPPGDVWGDRVAPTQFPRFHFCRETEMAKGCVLVGLCCRHWCHDSLPHGKSGQHNPSISMVRTVSMERRKGSPIG